jgi:hypothetical protein
MHHPIDPIPSVSANPGPTSEAGKAISSRNATRHGCCALDILILPTENIEEFKALEAVWFNTYQPHSEVAVHLLDELVAADWLCQRSVRTLAEIEARIFAAEPDPLQWTDSHHKTIARFQRYRTANQNAFNKCRKAVEEYRRDRASERYKEERSLIAKVRIKVFQEKNQPEPSIEEIIERMTKKAAAMSNAASDADIDQS